MQIVSGAFHTLAKKKRGLPPQAEDPLLLSHHHSVAQSIHPLDGYRVAHLRAGGSRQVRQLHYGAVKGLLYTHGVPVRGGDHRHCPAADAAPGSVRYNLPYPGLQLLLDGPHLILSVQSSATSAISQPGISPAFSRAAAGLSAVTASMCAAPATLRRTIL